MRGEEVSATKPGNMMDRIQSAVDEYRQETAANRQPGHCRRGHDRAVVMSYIEWPCYKCEFSMPEGGCYNPSEKCLEHLGEEVTS